MCGGVRAIHVIQRNFYPKTCLYNGSVVKQVLQNGSVLKQICNLAFFCFRTEFLQRTFTHISHIFTTDFHTDFTHTTHISHIFDTHFTHFHTNPTHISHTSHFYFKQLRVFCLHLDLLFFKMVSNFSIYPKPNLNLFHHYEFLKFL